MILLLFFFWADLSQWGQKQKKEINSQGLIKMFITQKLVNLTPSGQIQVTHKLIIPLIIPSPFFSRFSRFFEFFNFKKLGLGRQIKISILCMSVSSAQARIGFQQSWADGHNKSSDLLKLSFTNLCSCLSNYVCRPQFFVVASVSLSEVSQ